MIHYLENKNIDRKKWDACIESSEQHLPYGFSWFLDAVCEKWNALVQDDYTAVMPLPFKNKLGLKIIYQPFFTQQLGVFGNGNASEFINKIPSAFKHIHTNFNYLNIFEAKTGLKEQINLILPLHSAAPQLKFSENCRRNIKKSASAGLTLGKTDTASLIKIFRQTRGNAIAHLKTKNYETLSRVIDEFEKRKMASLRGIFNSNGNLLGGAVIVHYKNRNIFFFSSLTEEGKKSAAMYFLLNEFIMSKAELNQLFDFEGSNDPGLSRFYRSFGALEQNYFSYSVNRLPLPLKLIKK